MRDRENKKIGNIFISKAIVLFALAILFVPEAKSSSGAFFEKFGVKCSIDESESMERSKDSDWWVNSGGKMLCRKGTGRTLQKNIPPNSKWRKEYKKTNPKDTDGGKHPQNIFRLISKSEWQNFSQEASFRINKFNLSKSPNRNESNGILFLGRYQDSENLYYAGIRVDGYAVIKKKINGEYFEMAHNRLFSTKKYNRQSASRSHLLPKKKWISLKSEIRDTDSGNVEMKLYIKKKKEWILAAEAHDEPGKYGGNVISGNGHAGIRTDFMDVEFDKYRMTEI